MALGLWAGCQAHRPPTASAAQLSLENNALARIHSLIRTHTHAHSKHTTLQDKQHSRKSTSSSKTEDKEAQFFSTCGENELKREKRKRSCFPGRDAASFFWQNQNMLKLLNGPLLRLSANMHNLMLSPRAS